MFDTQRHSVHVRIKSLLRRPSHKKWNKKLSTTFLNVAINGLRVKFDGRKPRGREGEGDDSLVIIIASWMLNKFTHPSCCCEHETAFIVGDQRAIMALGIPFPTLREKGS